jgi:hypothetical protein
MKTGCRISVALAFGILFPLAVQAQVVSQGLIFHPVQPCRLFDTRPGQGGSGPLTPGLPVTFHVVGSTAPFGAQGGTVGGCAVPGYLGSTPRVKAVMLNFVAVAPAGAGNLRAWATDAAVPNASIINFTTGTSIANGLIIPVSQDATEGADLTVRADAASTNVLADVLGYFVLPDMGSRGACYTGIGPIGCAGLTLASGDNYLFGSTPDTADITTTSSQTCLVTANVAMSGATAATTGVALARTAIRNITDNVNTTDLGLIFGSSWGFYPHGVGDTQGAASKTYLWTLAADKQYRFGCHVSASGDFIGDTAWCYVSWICR